MNWSICRPRKHVRHAAIALAVLGIVAGITAACAPQDDEERISQAVAATLGAQSRIEETVPATVTLRPTATTKIIRVTRMLDPTSTPLPPPPQVVTDSMEAVTECINDAMSGALSRPRSNDFAALPYMSELGSPGEMVSREALIDYGQEYLYEFTVNLGNSCGLQVYGAPYIVSRQQEFEVLEASKAGSAIWRTGLLSPDMKHNCEEWEQSRHINYRSLRDGSVRRRGEKSGLNFDYAWGKVKEHISNACAPYF